MEAAARKIRKDITVSGELVEKSIEFDDNFSRFAGSAIIHYIDFLERKKFEEEMREGYEANAQYYKELNEDFDQLAGEGID